MRRRVGKGRVSQDLSPQTRSTARAPCPRVRPVFTLSPDTWARRHARAFVTSALWAGAFAHPTNDRIRAKPALANDGSPSAVPVTLGASDENSTHLVSGPVHEGDQLIVGTAA